MAIYEKCILIGGYSQPPRETAVTFAYNTLACQLLVSKSSHCVIQCHFNLLSPLSKEFVCDMVIGHCMDDDMEILLKRIRLHLHLQIANAVIHALRNALERYREIDMSIWKQLDKVCSQTSEKRL